MTNSGIDKRITFGIILIFFGLLFLLSEFNVFNFDFGDIFSPAFILLIIGLLILINSNKKLLGGILTGIAVFLIVPKVFPWLHYDLHQIIWPLILIVLGIYFIFRHSQKKTENCHNIPSENLKKDMIDDVAIFGGGNKVIYSDNFKGGSITAIFGGSEIDLTNCKLAEGTNVLDIVAIFGGTTLIVPKEWNVQLNVTPLFGGFSNKALKIPNLEIDKSRTLIVKGVAIFGGGEVKSIYS